MTKWRIPTAVLLALLLLVGCNQQEAMQEKQHIPEKEKVDEEQVKEVVVEVPADEEVDTIEVPKKPEYKHTFPFTGLGTNEDVTNRPITVMVNNHPKARPQSGLHHADVVYEVLAEGYITRFLALFQSEKPEIIGPIRSSRDYYIHLSQGLSALYVCYGQSPEALMMMKKREIDNINGIGYAYKHPSIQENGQDVFYRASFRKAPHNVYTSYENIMSGANRYKYDMTQDVTPFPFLSEQEQTEVTGDAATDVLITYSKTYNYNVGFEYDAEENTYQRFSSGEKTIDRETETPIKVENVFIVEAPHRVIDNEGRREVNIRKGGNAYLLQKGIVKKLEWRYVDGYILPYENGKPVGFIPGKSWINIVPTTPGLTEAVSFESKS